MGISRRFSTELLLTQLTETWREAVDVGLVVAVAFIDFKKAFDSVSHAILEMKLERDFGISGPLLDWLKSYLKERQQFTAVNGSTSDDTDPFWFSSRVRFGANALHSFHERSPVLRVFRIRLHLCRRHNGLLHKRHGRKKYCPVKFCTPWVNEWRLTNWLTPHPSKSEAMLISRRNAPVNIPPI